MAAWSARLIGSCFALDLFLALHCQPVPATELAHDGPPSAAHARRFRFEYGATIRGLPSGARVRIWLPVPPSNEHQKVQLVDRRLPAEARVSTEPEYGNQVSYCDTTAPDAGLISLATSYSVERREVQGLSAAARPVRDGALTAADRRLFLAPNATVPVGGKPLELLAGRKLPETPLAAARVLYDVVDDHVRYDKSQPGYGRGDVLWVCDSRFGNCTDFHSLFLSLARSQGIPARFEIGFPLPPQRGQGTVSGYHCWAFFFVDGHGWVPVDISEADKHPELKEYYFGNLTEDRVTFSNGRDLLLEPKQTGGPLNFFIYPHVEVDGRAWAADKMDLKFAYADE
jgi:transglutaminase-like putative cysteine protease